MALTLLRHATQKPPIGPIKLDLGHPLTAGLIADWIFNEYGSLTVNDASGHSPIGTLTHATWVSTSSSGSGVTFTGVTAPGNADPNGMRIDHSAAALNLSATPCTVLHQFATTTAGHGYLLGFIDEVSFVGYASQIGVINPGVVAWFGADQGWGDTHSGTVNDGVPHTLVIVINSATTGIGYLDSIANTRSMIGTDLRPASNSTLATRYLAGDSQGGQDAPFPGTLYRTAIWNRALTPGDVGALLSEPYAMYQTRPLQRWSPSVVTIQIARPTSDTSVGGWTTDQGLTTNEYSRINEVTRDDTTYVQSSLTPSADAVTFALGSLLTPVSGAQTLRYRYGKDSVGMQVNLTVELLQSGVTVQTWTHTDIATSFIEAAQTVTGVTDYTAPLSLRFTATQP